MTRWLKASIALNILLLGAIGGFLVIFAGSGFHLRPPPPAPPRAIVQFFEDLAEQGFEGDAKARILKVLGHHSDEMMAEMDRHGAVGKLDSPGEDRLTDMFKAGAFDDAALKEWVELRQTLDRARLTFIIGLFKDLAATLSDSERAHFVDTMKDRLAHPPGPGCPPATPAK